ncbi:MAG TPA: PDZ domain-containing protein [Streptosporangiaceae bacterium]|jgi:PDZ domain-containing protein|nr:PDZ domain-containing protein [Streptosporangiaceae bacterium]
MPRRTLTLYISAVAVILGILVAERLPVPYVILGPGPTLNTLGKDQSGKPLITISGRTVHPTSGHLNMVSITYEGGPGHQFNVFTALRAWLNPTEAVVPQSEIFAPGQSQQQVAQQDQTEMTSSQQSATAAALHQLGIGYKTVVGVVSVKQGLPAYGKLKAGDLITAVDGQPVTGTSQLTSLIKAHAGKPIRLTISRSGTSQQIQLTAKKVSGRPVLGVVVQEQDQFPFNVTIRIGQIGGPSAGMMFALGIIDKIAALNLTGGKFIAGTGEISANGTVSPIGGIQQKMVGARDAGATVFLAPAGNCADTAGAVPAGLRVVKVSTLSGAISALQNLKAGKPVPSC